MDATMKDILLKLRWVGHLAQTGEQRIPMQLLFGELVRRWRNLATADLKSIDVDREWWRAVYSDGLAQPVDSNRGVQSLQATKPTTVWSLSVWEVFQMSGRPSKAQLHMWFVQLQDQMYLTYTSAHVGGLSHA